MIGIDVAAGLFSSAMSSMFGSNGTAKSDTSSNSSDYAASFDKQLQQKTADLIKARDTNGDGTLSASESGMSSQAFAAIDTNGDGQLDTNELNAAYVKQSMTVSAQDLIKAYDTNGDGKLTASELNMSPDDFSAIDTAGTGAVGMKELMAADPLNSLYAKYAGTANIFTNSTSAANSVQLDLTA
ncbi:MAG: EF-hand domain-containing protein [Nitrospirae bacterium]|nr:EF-hand domain-containing protein [Nitrospirota bacterium]